MGYVLAIDQACGTRRLHVLVEPMCPPLLYQCKQKKEVLFLLAGFKGPGGRLQSL